MKYLPTLRAWKTAGIAAMVAGSSVLAYSADSIPAAEAPANHLSLARDAIKIKDWKKSLAELNLAVKEEPKNADVHNLLGYVNRKQAQPNLVKSFEHYNMALKLDPKHKGAHEYIGEAYLMDKKPAEAEKHLVQLEKICGNKTCEEYVDLAKSLSNYKAKAVSSAY